MFSTFRILLASMKETKVTHTKEPLKDRSDSSHDWTIHSKIRIPRFTLLIYGFMEKCGNRTLFGESAPYCLLK